MLQRRMLTAETAANAAKVETNYTLSLFLFVSFCSKKDKPGTEGNKDNEELDLSLKVWHPAQGELEASY